MVKRWRSVKSKTPIIGIDDGGFDRFSYDDIQVPVFGVIMKGATYVDGIIQCQIQKDDPDTTSIISKMLLESAHKPQIQAIFLQGITCGGFGVIDIVELHKITEIPVIVILKKHPDYQKIRLALKKIFPHDTKRWAGIKRAGKPLQVQDSPLLYLQAAGIHLDDAITLTKKCTVVGTIPEALRIAHLIGASNYRYLTQE
jgi:endonuclease V-like protein UPF0215 family